MFRIGSQPPPQSATPVSGSVSAQGGSGTSNQFQNLVARLDQSIATLSQQFGGKPPAGGGDAIELPHGPTTAGMGMPGGTLGTHSPFGQGIAAGEPNPMGVPKSGAAAGTVGTQKSAGTHHHQPVFKPGHHPVFRPQPGPIHSPVFRPQPHPGPIHSFPPRSHPTEPPGGPVRLYPQTGAPGGSVGTRQSMSSIAPQSAQVAPAPADKSLEDLLASVPGGGGGGGGAQAVGAQVGPILDLKGGGGAAGGVIGTRGSSLLDFKGGGGAAGGVLGTKGNLG
jgi:hypothetical protein